MDEVQYDSTRVCDNCGGPSPRTITCGGCQQAEHSFEMGLKEGLRRRTGESTALYQRAINRWGNASQLRMLLQEECGELVAAVNQHDRGRLSDAMVAGEVADVLIMAAQARLILGEELVDRIMRMKLRRLEQRLNAAEETEGAQEGVE